MIRSRVRKKNAKRGTNIEYLEVVDLRDDGQEDETKE